MSSVSDPSNFGATPVGNVRLYGSTRRGRGRWARIGNLGILWTDDKSALQLKPIENADNANANALRQRLVGKAQADVSATAAFDEICAASGPPTILQGDLADVPDA